MSFDPIIPDDLIPDPAPQSVRKVIWWPVIVGCFFALGALVS